MTDIETFEFRLLEHINHSTQKDWEIIEVCYVGEGVGKRIKSWNRDEQLYTSDLKLLADRIDEIRAAIDKPVLKESDLPIGSYRMNQGDLDHITRRAFDDLNKSKKYLDDLKKEKEVLTQISYLGLSDEQRTRLGELQSSEWGAKVVLDQNERAYEAARETKLKDIRSLADLASDEDAQKVLVARVSKVPEELSKWLSNYFHNK